MSGMASSPRPPVTFAAVLAYTALLGVLTAAVLSTAQVLRSTIDPLLGVMYSLLALLYAVPIGLVAAFLSLGIALGLRGASLRLVHSRTTASIAGGIGVVVGGSAVTVFLTFSMLHDLQPIAWLAYVGCLVGGVAFALWSRLCAEPAT